MLGKNVPKISSQMVVVHGDESHGIPIPKNHLKMETNPGFRGHQKISVKLLTQVGVETAGLKFRMPAILRMNLT